MKSSKRRFTKPGPLLSMRLGNGKQDFESAGQFLKKARQDEALDSDIKLEFEADHNSTEIEADETEESTEKCDRI